MVDNKSVPKSMKEKVEPIIKEIEIYCEENLNENFKEKAIELTAKLSRKRPSPLSSGRTKTWAAAILDTIMKINFVYEKTNPVHISKKDFIEKIGVSQSTINKKYNEIMELLNISIFSDEWFVEGNEEYTMSDVLDMQNMMSSLFGEGIASIFDDDNEDDDDDEKSLTDIAHEVMIRGIIESIESEDINELGEHKLEGFIETCIQAVCIIIGGMREGFDSEDYHYEMIECAQFILRKANEASVKLYEINKENINPYFEVIYMIGEMNMECQNFEEALENYEHVKQKCTNIELLESVEHKIFSIRYFIDNDIASYVESFSDKNDALWLYNKALYNYSINNELMAIKYLKEGLRKNKIIAELLLDNINIVVNPASSPLEIEALKYNINCKWIWSETNGALEWLFYKKQELKK